MDQLIFCCKKKCITNFVCFALFSIFPIPSEKKISSVCLSGSFLFFAGGFFRGGSFWKLSFCLSSLFTREKDNRRFSFSLDSFSFLFDSRCKINWVDKLFIFLYCKKIECFFRHSEFDVLSSCMTRQILFKKR